MNIFKRLRILELGRVFSGPLCGMLLADLGAEVIKIERPGVGDESRQFGRVSAGGNSCYFNSLNRNKKSVALNLKEDEDKSLFVELVRQSDVLLHNWRQKSLDKLGFGYEKVKRLNPRLIYCSITGYGYNSSQKDLPSQDIIAQSLSGFMSLTGEPNGIPLKTGIPVVDYVTGLYAANAIMSALLVRQHTGEGQLVHTSLLETALAMTSFEACAHLSTGYLPHRKGNRHPAICPYNVYQTVDGMITIAVANQTMWINFCRALGMEKLLEDPKFFSNKLRLENQDELEKILCATVEKYNTENILNLLNQAGVSCSVVNEIADAFNDSRIKELDMIERCKDDPSVSFVGKPFTLEKVSKQIVSKPPNLDEHKDDVRKLVSF